VVLGQEVVHKSSVMQQERIAAGEPHVNATNSKRKKKLNKGMPLTDYISLKPYTELCSSSTRQ
jgi:hypothetical protein